MGVSVATTHLSPPADLPELVAAAVAGDRGAWDGLVLRFTPLVASVIRGYRLSDADADDVCQKLWLKLVKHLKDLREPRALPGWIVTCTRHEAIRVLSARRRIELVDPHASSRIDRVDHPELDEDLLRQESRQAVRAALGELSEEHRTLQAAADLRRLRGLLRRDRSDAWYAHREHRSDPSSCLKRLRKMSAVRALAPLTGLRIPAHRQAVTQAATAVGWTRRFADGAGRPWPMPPGRHWGDPAW